MGADAVMQAKTRSGSQGWQVATFKPIRTQTAGSGIVGNQARVGNSKADKTGDQAEEESRDKPGVRTGSFRQSKVQQRSATEDQIQEQIQMLKSG